LDEVSKNSFGVKIVALTYGHRFINLNLVEAIRLDWWNLKLFSPFGPFKHPHKTIVWGSLLGGI